MPPPPPPPQTWATVTDPTSPLVLEHIDINISDGEIKDPIRDCLAWPRVLASTCCRGAATQASRYLISLLLSLFLYLILHLWLCCVLRLRADLSLSLSLFLFELKWDSLSVSLCFSMSNCLYFITLFDILTLSVCEFVVLCIVNFFCCECFIFLMFCVMLIGSCDSCLLSGGLMGTMGSWGGIFELGKWIGGGNKGMQR